MKMRKWNLFSKSALAAIALSVATLSSCTKDETTDFNQQPQVNAPISTERIAPNEYVVVLKDKDFQQGMEGMNNDSKDAALHAKILKFLGDKGMSDVKMPDEATVNSVATAFLANLTSQQVAKLEKDPSVQSVEPNLILTYGKHFTTSGTVTTTSTSTQRIPWGIKRVGGPVASAGKVAWIIDTGVDIYHPDLNVDTRRSQSFLTSAYAGNWSSPIDEIGHGTHVAGIIAAKDNGIGTVGVAADATIVALKVFDKNGNGSLYAILKALDYIAKNGKAGNVVNMSLGCSANTTLDNAVKNVASKGIFVAIAAGNSSTDCSYSSPARVNAPNVYTASAMDSTGTFAKYSNYGSPVDYASPGTYIYSTYLNGSYTYMSGTSMASPHLAGVLLATGGHPSFNGYVKSDPDTKTDPIIYK